MWGFFMLKQDEIEKYFKTLIKQINKNNHINQTNIDSYKIFLDKTNPDLVIRSIQKVGFFRPSKYNFDIKVISMFFQETINHTNFKKFSQYLISIQNLFLTSKKAKNCFNQIKEFILSERNLIKYFFAKSDDIFYEYENNKEPELILECISFLIIEIKNNQHTNGINASLINIINDKDYTTLIRLSKIIVSFKKIEIKIDFFEYFLEKVNNKNYKLTNESFEKNISMSYIQYDQQRYATHHETIKINQQNETFEETINKILNESNINLFAEIRPLPFPRVCPKIITTPILLKLFTTDFIYLEEKSLLNFFFIDNFISANYINKPIYKNFTILDIIKIQRIFKFISKIYRIYLKKNKIKFNKNKIKLASIIPISSIAFLDDLLQKTLNSNNKNYLELVKDIISTDFYKLNDHFDIQYNPILSLGNDFIISPTILAKSNLIRSILIKINNNLSISPNGDKMIQSLEKKLINLGFSIATEVKLGAYEIDIIAKKGNNVFIFECKNSYHPVNEFELRNSFSHIQKASNQLNNLEKMIKNKSTRQSLSKKIGFSLYKANFHYAIILSNRMFNGYIYNNYRCINSYILNNLLDKGLVTINSNKYSLWKNSSFHENDLIDFINGKFISDYEFLAHENFVKLKVKDITISCQRFGFSLEEVAEHIERNYNKI